MRGRLAGVLAGSAALVVAAPGGAGADTFRVTQANDHAGACNARCSLREAVIAANDNLGDDRVRLPGGRHELTIGGPGEDSAAEGDLDVRNAERITIVGAGMRDSVIDATRIDRVFNTIGLGTSLVLKDLKVTGGKSKQSYEGAGIEVEGSTSARLVRVRVSGNTTAADTSYDGAGIFNGGSLTLSRSVVSGNVTKTGDGGGIENRGDLDVIDSTISANQALAGDGAGISMNSADSLLLDGSTVSGNRAGGPDLGGDGAGIYAPGTLTVSTVVNSTVSGNRARGESAQGGGLYARGEIGITNATVASNEARGDAGGGIFAVSGADVNLLNAIVAQNRGEAGGQNCGGDDAAFDTLGNNLENRDTCALTAPDDLPDSFAGLGPLADNGGRTRTHALLGGSDAINAGNLIGCPPADQRGVSRPQGPACDIGAFERRP